MLEAISAGAVAAALAAKALDRAEEGTMSAAAQLGRRTIDCLRAWFAGKGDEEGSRALRQLADAPRDRGRERVLAAILADRAEKSPALRAALEALAEESRREGIGIGVVGQIATGERITQIDRIENSQVNVSHVTPDRDRG